MATPTDNPMTGPQAGPDLAQAVLQLQTQVANLQRVIQGDPAQGVLSYDQVLDHVRFAAPKVPALEQGVSAVAQRVTTVEDTADPVLKKADEEIGKLQAQSRNIQEVIDREVNNLKQVTAQTQDVTAQELAAQNNKHDTLIQHAREKFNELENSHQSLVDAARTKFDVLDALRTNFELQVADKVQEIDKKMAQVSVFLTSTAAAGRGNLTTGSGTGLGYFKGISECKAIQFLDKYSGDTRVGYKAWTRKLKNALDEARGPGWREALDGIEGHRITDDFEELTSVDDQWDEYFERQYGYRRRDGKEPIDLAQFKKDLSWILTDKLGEDLLELIHKHEQNGLRSYKKLFIWSVDISSNAKHVCVSKIMNPDPARSNEELADAIEKWDRDQMNLMKIDPKCVLTDPLKLPAFKKILTPEMLEHVENQMDSSISDNYTEVRKRVYGWALKKRLNSKQDSSGGLDQLSGTQIPDNLGNTPTWGGGQSQPGYQPTSYSVPQDPWSVDAVGKGKGAFKGYQGGKSGPAQFGPYGKSGSYNMSGTKGQGKGPRPCWTCGDTSHLARDCPQGKGQGKGKGNPGGKGKGGLNELSPGTQATYDSSSTVIPPPCVPCDTPVYAMNFNGYCYNCWAWGHPASQCPQGKGGKGFNSFEYGMGASNGTPAPSPAPEAQGTGSKATQEQSKVLSSLDLGGKNASATGNTERTLRHVFEEAGWHVAEGRGKRKSRQPTLSTVLELLELDRLESYVNGTASVPEGYGWYPLNVTIDSGACDHVVPPNLIDPSQVKVTEAVRQGVHYTTANGSKLANLGEIEVEGVTDDQTCLNLTFQVAAVKKSLGSVRKICDAGNRVVFENISDVQGGYVEDTTTGARTPINFEGGTYGVTLWRLMKKGNKDTRPELAGANAFEALSEDEEDEDQDVAGAPAASSGFPRHA